MQYVFIDTSVFRNKDFDIRNAELQSLKVLAEAGQISLVCPKITLLEYSKHVAESHSNIRRSAGKVNMLLKIAGRDEIDLDDLTSAAQEKWNEYLTSLNPIEVGVDSVNLEEVFIDYQKGNPPFSNKKKNEFPDAFTIRALTAWAEQNDIDVSLVTTDGDFGGAVEGRLKLEESLRAFLDNISAQRDYYEEASKAFEQLRADIETKAAEKLSGMFYTTEYEWFGAVEDTYVDNVNVVNTYVIYASESGCTVEFDADVDFFGTVSFARDNRIYRDSDTRDFVAVETESHSLSTTISLSLTAEIGFSGDDVFLESVITPRRFKFEIELKEYPYDSITVEGIRD